ncbi:hypothetical protein [Iodobacter sp.]|uniref:hypothetical protein n=1 Tax=Iodobacter sp. TaxID=1915058 RepID=UPI0025DF49EB|nr:hypothetical protein [Iodobacter sp.]
MSNSKINRIIHIFSESFQQMSVDVPMPDIERLAILVHRAMENTTRKYHTADHVFQLCEGLRPRAQLAALFHDLVYYQLDWGFPQNTGALLNNICQLKNNEFTLPDPLPNQLVSMCAALFSFTPGGVLPPHGGMNEFLSAVVAVSLLKPWLPLSDLIAIAACIEATIPFRDDAATQQLAAQIHQQSRQLLGMHDVETYGPYVNEVMQDAISLSNQDVMEFAQSRPRVFLSSTWLLIEESNVPLNAVGAYTLQDYRAALLRMEIFLQGLKEKAIFHQYEQQPSNENLQHLQAAARRNIYFSCDFLAAKLTTIAMLEAIAMATGGDGPISMFLGDIRHSNGKPERAEDYLPEANTAADINQELLQIFDQGRSEEAALDLNASPVTAFLYRCLGHQGTLQAWGEAQKMFKGELSPHMFLKSLDPTLVTSMITACMHISLSRQTAMQALQNHLFHPEAIPLGKP